MSSDNTHPRARDNELARDWPWRSLRLIVAREGIAFSIWLCNPGRGRRRVDVSHLADRVSRRDSPSFSSLIALVVPLEREAGLDRASEGVREEARGSALCNLRELRESRRTGSCESPSLVGRETGEGEGSSRRRAAAPTDESSPGFEDRDALD